MHAHTDRNEVRGAGKEYADCYNEVVIAKRTDGEKL